MVHTSAEMCRLVGDSQWEVHGRWHPHPPTGNLFFSRNFADFSRDLENLRTLSGYAHLCVFSHQSKLGFSEPFNRSLRCFFNSRTFFFSRCNLSWLCTGSVFANFPTCYNLFLTPESIPVEFFVCLFCGHPQTRIVAKKFDSPCAHILNWAFVFQLMLWTGSFSQSVFSFFVLLVGGYTV